jgi:hypothetical protein
MFHFTVKAPLTLALHPIEYLTLNNVLYLSLKASYNDTDNPNELSLFSCQLNLKHIKHACDRVCIFIIDSTNQITSIPDKEGIGSILTFKESAHIDIFNKQIDRFQLPTNGLTIKAIKQTPSIVKNALSFCLFNSFEEQTKYLNFQSKL